MALCRCLEERHRPKGRTNQYIGYVQPIGYPNTALICGRCDNPGVIWLDSTEEKAYHNGIRIFTGPTNFAKIKADDAGIKK
jgi:hypothetical protein